MSTVRNWLQKIPLEDPIERRQAEMLQVMLLFIFGATLVGLPITLITNAQMVHATITVLSYGFAALSSVIAFILLRKGHFQLSVVTITIGTLLAVSGSLAAMGTVASLWGLCALMIPITLAGLLLGRKGVLLSVGLTAIVVCGIAAWLIWNGAESQPAPPQPIAASVSIFLIVICVLGFFLDRFGTTLRTALADALAREHELDHLRETLEATVDERTKSLQATVNELQASHATIRELNAPILPVLPGVLVAPMIGAFDSTRAATLSDSVLDAISRHHARYVIFDITGVPLVDTLVAQALLRTTQAVKLLGATSLIVGIRPEVAQTMIALNIEIEGVGAFSNLQEAVAALLDAPVKNGATIELRRF